MSHKNRNTDIEHGGGEPGEAQQRVAGRDRRDRQNMGTGMGSVNHAQNQGREGGRGSGRNGRREKGDRK